MAHFATIVLVSKQNGLDRGDPYIAQKVKDILAPYDEELEVKPYEITCDYCRNGKTENGDECEDCQGSGVRLSDWNPHGEWDYWIFGGRYDGFLFGKPRISQGEDDWRQWCVNNCISTDELIKQINPIIPYGVFLHIPRKRGISDYRKLIPYLPSNAK